MLLLNRLLALLTLGLGAGLLGRRLLAPHFLLAALGGRRSGGGRALLLLDLRRDVFLLLLLLNLLLLLLLNRWLFLLLLLLLDGWFLLLLLLLLDGRLLLLLLLDVDRVVILVLVLVSSHARLAGGHLAAHIGRRVELLVGQDARRLLAGNHLLAARLGLVVGLELAVAGGEPGLSRVGLLQLLPLLLLLLLLLQLLLLVSLLLDDGRLEGRRRGRQAARDRLAGFCGHLVGALAVGVALD